MSIEFQVLGQAGHDNAVFVRVHTGQAVYRLQFDCGEGCIAELSFTEMRAIDHLCFSHLHMDHIGGFDTFFRGTFNRDHKQNMIWGPPETARIMHHRFRGFMWNLYLGEQGTWYVNDVYPDRTETTRFEAGEAFALAHPHNREPTTQVIIATKDYSVEAYQMNHGIPSLAYIIREKPRLNIDTTRLTALGLRPGHWLQWLKDRRADEAAIVDVDGVPYNLAWLRASLLVESPGESLAYLTDFILDEDTHTRLVPVLQGCTSIVCESQYRHADLALAQRNYHMTVQQAAELAREAQVGKLILFHVSDRYRSHEWREMLAEARSIFPNTHFPAHWRLTTES